MSRTLLYLLVAQMLTLQIIMASEASGQAMNKVRVRVDVTNASLTFLLESIEAQTGFVFTYDEAVLHCPIRFNFHAETNVQALLQEVANTSGFSFRQINKNIAIQRKSHPVVETVQQPTPKSSITGIITDEITGETLVGAAVFVEGVSAGVTSDTDGHYAIAEVKYGNRKVTCSFVGYDKQTLTVKIDDTNPLVVNFAMKKSSTSLSEVVVNAKSFVKQTSNASFVNEMKLSPIIITGISAQQIGLSQDKDAGEVARRLPGVTVVNNFVNIRGMHERYNQTYINGMLAPSTEADKNSFSFNLIPAGIIDKMTVYRSPAPELMSDWGGGIIDIQTKNSAKAREFQLNLSGSINPGVTFNQYYSTAKDPNAWLGGKHSMYEALPDGFPSGVLPGQGGSGNGLTFADGRKIDLETVTEEELAANTLYGQQLPNHWNMHSFKARPDLRGSLSYYDTWSKGLLLINNLTSISTTQTVSGYNQYIQRLITTTDSVGDLDNEFYRDTVSKVTARWGALETLSAHWGDKHTIKVTAFYNQQGTNQTTLRQTNEVNTDYNAGLSRNVIYCYQRNKIFTGQVAGDHTFGHDFTHTIHWAIGKNYAKNDQPDQRQLNLKIPDDSTNGQYYITANAYSSKFLDVVNSHYYQTSTENNRMCHLTFEEKLKWGQTLKVGFDYEYKTRSMEVQLVRIGYNTTYYYKNRPDLGTTSEYTFVENTYNEYNAESFFDPANFEKGWFVYNDNRLSGAFDARGITRAGFIAASVPLLFNRVLLYGGTRYTAQNLRIVNYKNTVGTVGKDTFTAYWLPSVNLTITLLPSLQLRAAYGKTLNRPNYREYMESMLFDVNYNNITYGNSSLRNAEITSYDARLEWYPTDRGELLAAGVFYKNLTNAIEPYYEVQALSFTDDIIIKNTPKAKVYGLEAELRKNMGFIPLPGAKYVSVIANLALLKSEVKLFTSAQLDSTWSADFKQGTRPLVGTAPYVVNAGLYFENPKTGTRASVMYNVLGSRLIFAGSTYYPSTYDFPRHEIDITFKQQVGKYMELTFGIHDLLNQPVKMYRDYNQNGYFDQVDYKKLGKTDWIYTNYRPGCYYTAGINIRF